MIKRVRTPFTAAFTLCLALLTFCTITSAQNGLPPLIDRQIFFGNPEIVGAQI